MHTNLISEWLAGEDALPILDEASVSVARQAVRDEGERLGLPASTVERLAVAASELGHNQLSHARRGWLAVRALERDGVPGIELVAADTGRGMADPAKALRGGLTTAGSLGVGLSGVRRMCDELDVDVRLEEGTCVWGRAFAREVPRRREVGIYGRPHPDERVSGDGAFFSRARADGLLVLGVVDGLGHGELAREATRVAIGALRAHLSLQPAEQLGACDKALAGTRGAVMAVAHLDDARAALHLACAGNIGSLLAHHHAERRLGCMAATLGAAGPRPVRVHVERTELVPRELLVLFSDGISSKITLEGEGDLFFQHPVVIAQHLAERYARGNDDVLVAVVR